jgi:alcohol dehydrogenase
LTGKCLYFTGERTVEVREFAVGIPQKGEVCVASELSAVSAGTELLVYRNQFPRDMPVDASIAALRQHFSYPLRYGYAVTGRISSTGQGVDAAWKGRRVFIFHPHATHCVVPLADVVSLPSDLPPADAVFLPFMETAVNLLLDGRPLIGEKVAIFGQGTIGLLATALLAHFPLAALVTFDRYEARRRKSLALGATVSMGPQEATDEPGAGHCRTAALEGGADLTFELSGSPDALNDAIRATAFGGRIIIGSWYGEKRAPVDLGGYFHRSRIRLISSQVSTLGPSLSPVWTRQRRLDVTLSMLKLVRPSRLITHTFPLERGRDLYRMLDTAPEGMIQAVFAYDEAAP